MMIAKRKSLLLFTLFLCLAGSLAGQEGNHNLWYKKPAEKWTDALPVGNGRLGAMVFGGVEKDQLQFNEETLWTGKPRNYNRKGASKYLPEIRKLLFDGKQKEAETLAQAEFMGLQSEAGDRESWIGEMKAGKGISGNPATFAYMISCGRPSKFRLTRDGKKLDWKTWMVPFGLEQLLRFRKTG